MRNFFFMERQRRGIAESACQRLCDIGKKGIVRAAKAMALIQPDAEQDKAEP
jgi:hypothetical protein